MRELVYVVAMALVGLALATVLTLTPWHLERCTPGTPVVELVAPGGVAGRR